MVKNVAFFVRHFLERGTEVAVFDYAHYNETILHNNSFIICFSLEAQKAFGMPTSSISYPMFEERFPIITIDSIHDMSEIISRFQIHTFYTLTHGSKPDIYHFENKDIWQTCKTIKHCVFDLSGQEGDVYCAISHTLNKQFNTQYPVVPHIVHLPDVKDDFRNNLNIPINATVYGRYGGFDTFDVECILDAIKEYSIKHPDTYFLFMNTPQFCEPRANVFFLEATTNKIFKTKFVNTCDAMIHARKDGETFGLSVAEFAFRGKQIITYKNCISTAHLDILGDKTIQYESKEDFLDILDNFHQRKKDMEKNVYKTFSPEYVMKIFQTII